MKATSEDYANAMEAGLQRLIGASEKVRVLHHPDKAAFHVWIGDWHCLVGYRTPVLEVYEKYMESA